jgi:hypothetical protein
MLQRVIRAFGSPMRGITLQNHVTALDSSIEKQLAAAYHVQIEMRDAMDTQDDSWIRKSGFRF